MVRFTATLTANEGRGTARRGGRVDVAIEIDDQPVPTDKVPPDLAKAIGKSAATKAAWANLPPSHKREHVKHVLEAKKPETRARRIASTLELLRKTPARTPARAASARRPSRRA